MIERKNEISPSTLSKNADEIAVFLTVMVRVHSKQELESHQMKYLMEIFGKIVLSK